MMSSRYCNRFFAGLSFCLLVCLALSNQVLAATPTAETIAAQAGQKYAAGMPLAVAVNLAVKDAQAAGIAVPDLAGSLGQVLAAQGAVAFAGDTRGLANFGGDVIGQIRIGLMSAGVATDDIARSINQAIQGVRIALNPLGVTDGAIGSSAKQNLPPELASLIDGAMTTTPPATFMPTGSAPTVGPPAVDTGRGPLGPPPRNPQRNARLRSAING